jgi:hypothetical protein
MAVITNVVGQESGYMPGGGKSVSVTDGNEKIIGSVGMGQKAEIVIVPNASTGDSPSAVFIATTENNRYSMASSVGRPLTANVPVELYGPSGGGAVVWLKKMYANTPDFTAYLYTIDGSGTTYSAPPLISSTSPTNTYAATASGVSLALPSGALAHDLLCAWVGWTGADATLDDQGRGVNVTGWTELMNENGTAGISNGATPTVRFFYHILEEGEEGPFRFGKTGTSYTWGGILHSLRASGISDLEGYGLGFASYGMPGIQLEAGTSVGLNWLGADFQEMQFEESSVPGMMGAPCMITACITASGYAGDGSGGVCNILRDGGHLIGPVDRTWHPEDVTTNGLLGAGWIVTGRPDIQLTLGTLFQDTPFDWFGGWVIISKISGS